MKVLELALALIVGSAVWAVEKLVVLAGNFKLVGVLVIGLLFLSETLLILKMKEKIVAGIFFIVGSAMTVGLGILVL